MLYIAPPPIVQIAQIVRTPVDSPDSQLWLSGFLSQVSEFL